MQGWSTGSRNRHTLTGVPTRPTVKRNHVHADMLRKQKAATNFFVARLLRLDYRATKPRSRLRA